MRPGCFRQIEEEDVQKKTKKRQIKIRFDDPIKKCAKLTAKLITAECKLNFIKFKLDEDPLQNRVYFLYFMN